MPVTKKAHIVDVTQVSITNKMFPFHSYFPSHGLKFWSM